MNPRVNLPLFAILFYIRFIFLSRLLFIFVIYVIYRLVLLYILPVAQRIRTYDILCISKAYSMTFQKNRRYPAATGGTACGRACLRCARRQAIVYAGLRCVRRQCAQAGDCICRLAAGASSRHHRPSPAESAAEFAGLCARKLGRGAQACVHTNSKSRKSVSPPSCRGAQACVYTNAALGA